MTDRVYKKIEIVGTSQQGVDHAIQNAVATAAKTVKNMDWFEVSEIRGHIADGKIDHFQVVMKLGFRLNN